MHAYHEDLEAYKLDVDANSGIWTYMRTYTISMVTLLILALIWIYIFKLICEGNDHINYVVDSEPSTSEVEVCSSTRWCDGFIFLI